MHLVGWDVAAVADRSQVVAVEALALRSRMRVADPEERSGSQDSLVHTGQVGRLALVPEVLRRAKLASLDLCHSFPAAVEYPALVAALAVANGEAHHSCSSVAVGTAVVVVVAAADAVEVEVVARIGRSAVAASVCSARKASEASEVELVVLETDPGLLPGLVYLVQIACTQQVEEERVVGPVARVHCTAVAVALIGRGALSRRRLARLRANRTR